MRSRLLRKAAAVSMAVVALACATAHPDTASAAPPEALPGTPGCFWLKSFNDWTVLNDSELIVHAPLTQDAYLVKLFQPVFGLNYYFNLGFVDVMQNGYICGPSRDYLAVPRYTLSRTTRLTRGHVDNLRMRCASESDAGATAAVVPRSAAESPGTFAICAKLAP